MFDDENGNRWVVKLPGNPFESQLGNDYLGLQLAPLLRVPVPESHPIVIDEACLATMDVQPAWVHPGLGLATRYFLEVETVTPVSLSEGDESLSRLVVLDCWLETLDRRRPDGQWNLLRRLDAEGGYLAIDFGMSMQRNVILGAAGSDRCLPPGYPAELLRAAGLHIVQSTIAELTAISDAHIRSKVTAVPSSMMNPQHQQAILEFLVQRKRAVAALSASQLLRGEG